MNRMTFLRSALALAAAGLLSAAADAATVTIDQTLDLTKTTLASGGFQYVSDPTAFDAATPFSLAIGDTLDYTITFAGSQGLTLQSPSTLWAYIYTDGGPSAAFTGTGSLTLLNASGGTLLASNPKTDSEGEAHFGQQFGSGDFAQPLPSTLTFYGVHYVGTVTAYTAIDPSDDPITSRDYLQPSFSVTAAAVPEPSSVALLMAGLGAVVVAGRRRKAGKGA